MNCPLSHVFCSLSHPLLLCLCGKPLSSLYPLWECRLARFSINLHVLWLDKGIFLIISFSLSLSWWFAKSLILCVSGLVLGIWELDTAATVISWARGQVCSAAGSFSKVARPIQVLSVMSQQDAHVTVFTHSSVSTPFARITLHDIQNYTELCWCHIGSCWSFWYWPLLPALPPLLSAADCPACSRNS